MDANIAREAETTQRQLAEANFQTAFEAVDQMLTRVANEKLLKEPHMLVLRRQLLDDALRFYQAFLKDNHDDPKIRTETAMAYIRVGCMYRMSGEYESAVDYCRKGLALLDRPFRDKSAEVSRLDGLVRGFTGLGATHMRAGRYDAAEQAYDIDGDVTAFSDTELENIETIWTMVAEDFAPFNIEVTTEEPGVLAEGTPIDESGGTIGNGSHYDSFTNSIANVAYITGGSTPAAGGNLSSHEAAHGFGLGHQNIFDENGVKTGEYNRGDGSWKPLMGISTPSSTIVTTWHDGSSYPGAPYFQDDMAILAGATNGFGYRTDDHADTSGSATALSSDGTWSDAVLIETNDDVDLFSFTITTAGHSADR